VPSDLN